MRELIDEADVFQLFWSTNSMHSEQVRQEWEHALALDRPNFIRPTYWEQPMPRSAIPLLPPEPLGQLHFHALSPPQTSPLTYRKRPTRRTGHRRMPGNPARELCTSLICPQCGVATLGMKLFPTDCGSYIYRRKVRMCGNVRHRPRPRVHENNQVSPIPRPWRWRLPTAPHNMQTLPRAAGRTPGSHSSLCSYSSAQSWYSRLRNQPANPVG